MFIKFVTIRNLELRISQTYSSNLYFILYTAQDEQRSVCPGLGFSSQSPILHVHHAIHQVLCQAMVWLLSLHPLCSLPHYGASHRAWRDTMVMAAGIQ